MTRTMTITIMKTRTMKIKKYIILVFTALAFTACSEDIFPDSASSDAVELTDVKASVEAGNTSRAVGDVVYLQDRISRYQFVSQDKMTFTKIQRSSAPIKRFQYKDVAFTNNFSGAWERDKSTGYTLEDPINTNAHPERVYWSDASSAHTFVGYSLPKDNISNFDWKKSSYTYTKDGQKENFETYYGAIGDPTNSTECIDYNPTEATTETIKITEKGEEKDLTFGYSQKLRDEDLLLTYDNSLMADNSVANIKFYHALSSVRIIVNISGFYGTATDAYSRVSDMVLHNQPTLYRWKQNSAAVDALLAEGENTTLSDLWTGETTPPTYNQRKNMKLWNTKPEGEGQGASKLFTFYGITVPQDADYFNTFTGDGYAKLKMTFKVTYPDPLKNEPETKTITKDYTAEIANPVKFYPGKCTTIHITLNHKDETMTVGAEYDDWDYIDTPDEGVLKKNSTFVDNVSRNSVYLFGDAKATADDATWLYIDEKDKELRDVYGNNGSEEHPFVISTAQQFVAFAHEVLGTNRVACEYRNLNSTTKVLDAGAGFDFTGYYVKLDANMTMQPNTNLLHDANGFYTLDSDGHKVYQTPSISWPGIGNDTHPFNGMFNGGFRHINLLYGHPLFTHIGPEGIIDHIFITDALGIDGSGSIAETNDGIICGSHVEGDIDETNYTDYCGSIVGVNNGVLIACSHIGSITGNAGVLGALLGKNDGILVTCYNVGDAKNNAPGKPAYAGVGEFTPRSVAYCCYYNGDFYNSQDYDLTASGVIGHVAFPLTTSEMQSNKYVNQTTTQGEITDAGDKLDEFFRHWSLNVGLARAIQLLASQYKEEDPDDTVYTFHTEADRGGYLPIGLKKAQVKWLVNHFSDDSHQFQFIPGTYPKLK